MSTPGSIVQTRRSALFLPIVAALIVTGCFPWRGSSVSPLEAQSSASSALTAVIEDETKNVSYRGMLSRVMASVVMEGTHQLTLQDGRLLSLESEVIPFADYEGKEVEVVGDVRPAVEGGGLVMRVRQVVDLTGSSSLSSSSLSSESVSSEIVSASSVPPPVSFSEAATASSKPKPLVVKSASISSVSSAFSASSASSSLTLDAELQVRANAMAKMKMDPAQWTRRYCTGTIGFCIPVHKNWYFKSFGASTGVLWRVELSSVDIASLGAGPIVLTLQSGDAGPEDGKVFGQGETVLGVHSWTNARHFELRAPAALKDAVTYILLHIEPYTEQSS